MTQRRSVNVSDMTASSEDELTELLEYTGASSDKIRNPNLIRIRGNNNENEVTSDSKITSSNMSTDMRPSQEQALQEKGRSSIDNSHTARSSRQSGGGGSGSAGPNNTQGETDAQDETDVIGDIAGQFGRWQLIMCFTLSFFQIPNTFHIICPVYQSARKEFWCERPAHLANVSVDIWRNMSRSADNCHQAVYDWTKVSTLDSMTPLPNNTPVAACTAWEYATDDILGNTWASEWNLVCDKEFLLSVAEMVFLLGVATGGLISGYLSDMFGRKIMLFITASLQITTAISLYFAQSFVVYVILRCLLGFVSVAVVYAGMILGIEFADGKWRMIAGMINLFPLPLSYMLISYMAFLTQDFRVLQLWISVPSTLLMTLWFVLPESPRWLLIKGRVPELSKVVEHMAKLNRRELPPNYESLLKPPPQNTSSAGMCGLFQTRYLRIISACFFVIWFTINLVYYGIALNMNTFGGNIYVNSALAGLVEFPALAAAAFLNHTVGKKWVFRGCFLCGAVSCGCAAIIEGMDDVLWLKITLLMFGKFIISTGNTVMPVYTAELYPTAIRNAAVGACNVSAGIALILTPYLSLLNKFEDHLMMITLTVATLIASVAVFFIPEHQPSTKDENA